MTKLIGAPPAIFEPAKCQDTGCYGSLSIRPSVLAARAAYGCAGGWGNLQLPFQFFITTSRPAAPGIGYLAGYGTSGGGYGFGSIGYVELSSLPGYIADDEIRTTLLSLLPANTTAWMRIN